MSYKRKAGIEDLFRAIQVTGMDQSEAKVLATMIGMRTGRPSELIKITGLSRGTVYSSLAKLLEEGYIERRGTKPITYSVVRVTMQRIVEDLDNIKKSFLQVTSTELKESSKVLEEICEVFEKNGFAIKELPLGVIRRQRFSLRINRIAEGEYSIGVLLYDRGVHRLTVSRSLPPIYYQISENQESLGTITTFIFVHPDFRESESAYRDLTEVARSKVFPRRLNYGIQDRPFYVFRTTDNILEGITNAILDIRRRKIVATELVLRLRELLSQAEQLTDACREHGRDIDEMVLGKYRPFSRVPSVVSTIRKIIDPVERIKNRETRNLQIFRNRLNGISVKIGDYIDSFESRTFLPTSARLENDIKELDMLISKFIPVEFELNDLRENLFSYATSCLFARKDKKKAQLNPFMFTEPYETDSFSVNQEEVKKHAPDLASAIVDARADFFHMITGPAGCGKTHAIKYIYEPIMERRNIKTFYVDCPVSYDLVDFLSRELIQETNYPEDLLETVRTMRGSMPSTPKDLITMLIKVRDIMKSAGKNGVLIEIDELENMLPYPEEFGRLEGDRRPPLALRQLREILTARLVDNVGYVICCREKAYPLMVQSLGLVNVDRFTLRPGKLSVHDLESIIAHRYEAWNVNGLPFSTDAVAEIVSRVDGNARNAIRYCREVFKFAVKNNLKKIESKTMKNVKEIPIFSY